MADETTLQPEAATPEVPPNPADLTPEMVDVRRYYTLEQLAAMPAETLEELWLACPDRPFYEAALKRAVDDTFGEGAVVSDIDRLSVIETCILYYAGRHPDLPGSAPRIPTAQRPDGNIKWFKVSDRIRERLEAGLPLEDEKPAGSKPAINTRVLIPAVLIGMGLVCIVFFIISSLTRDKELISQVDMTATAAAAAVLPDETPTPTPLALEDIDRPIRAGDELRGYYPVLLEIVPSTGLPRVFPVQQRAVEIAEWDFEPDPDVASAVLGLVIRPVLGIPYTPANADFLSALEADDAIHLRMSTGQTLDFRVSDSERVSRQEVAIFEQSRPGIAIVLLQEYTADRLVVYGDYPSGQEAPGAEVASHTSTAAEGASMQLGSSLSLTVIDSTTSAGPAGASVPADWRYLLVDVLLEADEPIDSGELSLEVVDALGGRYAPVAVDPSITHFAPFQPTRLEAGQLMHATLAFLLPHDASTPSLVAGLDGAQARFALDATSLISADASALDVLILGAETQGTPTKPGELLVQMRIFNPESGSITLRPADVLAIFSPIAPEDAFPVGPAIQETSGLLPITIEPGQATDIELHFAWNGEPFAGLQIAGYRYLLHLR